MPEKNICILSHGPIANDGRILKTIDFLLSRDYSIRVLFPSKEPFKEFVNTNPGITLKPIKKRNSLFRKILRHTIYPLEFSYLATEANKLDHRFGYIYVNDLPSLHAGLKIKKRNTGSKLIYDSHEIFNETVNQFFPDKANLLKSRLFRILITIMRKSGSCMERKFVKHVDLFITVNESLKNYFEQKYQISGVQVMMNCPLEKEKHYPSLPTVDYRKMFSWEGPSRIFLYQGGWNKGRGLELLINTFKNTPKEFKLVIIGGGVLEETLNNLIQKSNLQNRVKLLGFVPQNILFAYTKSADVGINLLEPFNLSKAMASPNKLFEYIHAGIPIIASQTKENKIVFDEFDIGLLVENNKESILNALNYFLEKVHLKEKTKYHPLAQRKYQWESQVKILEKFFINSEAIGVQIDKPLKNKTKKTAN